MSIFSDYKHGYLTDREFRSACAREYKYDDWYEMELDEYDEEDECDDEGENGHD